MFAIYLLSYKTVYLVYNTDQQMYNLIYIYHNHHHLHISVMQSGHLLNRSGLMYPEVSSKIYHDSFCQLGSSTSGSDA